MKSLQTNDTDEYKYAVYLEKLRRTGETNMYGAAPYLVEKYGVTKKEADKILTRWIQNYDTYDFTGIV